MPQTYDQISTVTFGGSTSTTTFSNIPQQYTDLVISAWVSSATGVPNFSIRFNGDTATNYNWRNLFVSGGGSPASAIYNNYNGLYFGSIGTTTNITGAIIDIPSYSNTSINKNAFGRMQVVPSNGYFLDVGMWRSTAAINSITIFTGGGNFTSGSIITLYGIKAA